MKKAFSRLTLALMVVFAMSLAVAIPAMAATNAPPVGYGEVTLTKQLDVPAGTTVPDLNFQFNLAQVYVASQATTTAANTQWMPGSTFTTTVPAGSQVTFPASFNPRQVNFTGNTSADQTAAWNFNDFTFPHAGVFHFVVTEATNTNPTVDASPNDFLHYDDSIFIISVEVINVRDNATGNPVAPYLAVRTTVVMEADTVTGGSATHEAGEKTDLIFVNIYYNDESDLGIIKRITGDQADMSETFSITTTLTIPQQVFDANPTFNPAVFLTGARAPVVVDTLATPPTTLVSPQPTITITGSAGNPIVSVTTELGHGHRLFFPQLISGTLFQAMEIQEDNFAGQAVVTGPGAGTFPTTPVVDADVIVPGATDRFVSDTGTSVITFTNDYREMILAGLLVGSMPMIFALLMATLLLAMMVASRSRKRIEQLPIAC